MFLDLLDLPHSTTLHRYDPAIPEFNNLPSAPVDLLVSIDVLEHIEEHDLDGVLSEMRGLCRDAIIIVDTVPAKHTLSDGRNAHRTVHSAAWWAERIGSHFGALERVATPRRTRAGFKTWERSSTEQLRYAKMRLIEDAIHGMRQIANRHHAHWKVSKTEKNREKQFSTFESRAS